MRLVAGGSGIVARRGIRIAVLYLVSAQLLLTAGLALAFAAHLRIAEVLPPWQSALLVAGGLFAASLLVFLTGILAARRLRRRLSLVLGDDRHGSPVSGVMGGGSGGGTGGGAGLGLVAVAALVGLMVGRRR